jgi:outer membrane protein assembly factor BamB
MSKRRYYARKRRFRRKARARFYVILGVLIAALAVGIFFIVKAVTDKPGSPEKPGESMVLSPPNKSGLLEPVESETPTETPEPSMPADLLPQPVAGKTDPATFGFETKIMNDGNEVATYERPDPISFGAGSEYTALEGVITFRGNNYRDMPSWGTAEITEQKLTNIREPKQTGAINGWGGSGWTGQPLVVKWPDALREKMTSIYESFRNKAGFTEVIICSLDGNIYFEELETGEKTRNPIKIGAPTKGTASLDPRGYPIIYVGQGLNPEGSDTKCNDMYFRAYSLIDGKELYKFGAPNADPFALRSWQAYDSSALIDAETDTLIVPGENGVLYTVKLNTSYDESAGTVTMDPKPMVKYRYTTPANRDRDKASGGRWGIENSVVAWKNYVIFTDNAGLLQCVDLNTMTLVYANDLGDDSDVSMVLEEDPANGTFYLYTGCEYDESVHNAQPGQGTAFARKINGLTGEVIWEAPFTVQSGDVDGGILASPVLGKKGTSLEGLIIYNVTQEVKGESTTSRLVALDKNTRDLKWSYDMEAEGWSPSSPVPVYTADGQGYIIQCDIDGEVALIKADGQSATEVSKLSLKDEANKIYNKFEATPVVFGNYVVVGSRSKNLFFIKIS